MLASLVAEDFGSATHHKHVPLNAHRRASDESTPHLAHNSSPPLPRRHVVHLGTLQVLSRHRVRPSHTRCPRCTPPRIHSSRRTSPGPRSCPARPSRPGPLPRSLRGQTRRTSRHRDSFRHSSSKSLVCPAAAYRVWSPALAQLRYLTKLPAILLRSPLAGRVTMEASPGRGAHWQTCQCALELRTEYRVGSCAFVFWKA